MKFFFNVACFALMLAPVASKAPTAMDQVVEIITDLKGKVYSDGVAEQKSFDQYACWCEKTLERKASDISSAKELITETEILIKKLKGEIASHGAEVAQLNKDIAANIKSQKEATTMRDKDYDEYFGEKTESEQCIGALEAAVGVLTKAGTKKSGFLDQGTHTAQLLSVAGQVRTVLHVKSMPASVSERDLDLVKSFVAKPDAFMGPHAVGMSATQVGQNPFGDYAPQSSQIQGILKGMYDAFAADLEKANAHEAEAQKSFEELIATKKQEQATLEATLQRQETDQAEKIKNLNDSQILKDDTIEQLNADEAFFAESKDACSTKATEWSVRTRLRTEELNGMTQAINILSSSDAKKTFQNATTTFLQLASVRRHQDASSKAKTKAYGVLKKLASEYKSLKVARIAALVQMGGHFDKVIVMIDQMMELLRKEEAADIVHRDLCENSENANKNDLADIENAIQKTDAMIKRYENSKTDKATEITDLEGDADAGTGIAGTKKSIADMLDMRNKESAQFKQALKDDTDAVGLIKQAITFLSKFYKDNNIALGLMQKAPEYAKNPDKAPETAWSGSDYGGRKSESGGILAILAMLAEDLEKEMAEGRADDADAQQKYLDQSGALQNTLDAQEATKASLEAEHAALVEKIAAANQFKTGKKGDQDAGGDTKTALATDCSWVKTHFKTRQDKRKDEMDGLVDAKSFLSGATPLAPLSEDRGPLE